MSRERYQARSKVVQKLGRDGLVEQNRATGQEQRVSKRDADISFGPERAQEQQPGKETRQRAAQKKKLVRTMQQEYAEFRSSGFEEESAISEPGEQVQEEYHAPIRMADDVPAAPVIHEAETPRPWKHRQEKRNQKLRSEPEQRLSFESDQGQTLHFEADRTQEAGQDSSTVFEKHGVEDAPQSDTSFTSLASPAPETPSPHSRPDDQEKRQHRRIQYHQENTVSQQDQSDFSTAQTPEPALSMPAAETPAEPQPYDTAAGVRGAEQPEDINNPPPDTDGHLPLESENDLFRSPKADNRVEHILTDAPQSSILKEQSTRLRFDDGGRLRFEHGQQTKPTVADVRAPPRRQRTVRPESKPESHNEPFAPEVHQEQPVPNYDGTNGDVILPEPDTLRQEGLPSEFWERPVSENVNTPTPIRRFHNEKERSPHFAEHRQRLKFETDRETPVSVEKKRHGVTGEQTAKEVSS